MVRNEGEKVIGNKHQSEKGSPISIHNLNLRLVSHGGREEFMTIENLLVEAISSSHFDT